MVSTNTPIGGSRNHFDMPASGSSKNGIPYATILSQKFRKCIKSCLPALLLLAGLFAFKNSVNAQCVASCVDFAQIAVDPVSGVTSLTPAMFFNGNPGVCMSLTIDVSEVDCADVGTDVVVTLTATDQNGNVSSCKDTFRVVDTTPPDINCPSDTVLACGSSTDASVTGFPLVSDNCDWFAPVMTDSVDVPSGVPGQCQTIVRTWTSVDGFGNMNSCVQNITLEDTNNPVLDFNSGVPGNQTNPPAPVTVECDDPLPTPPTVTASDGCAGNLGTIAPLDTEVGRDADQFSCNHYDYQIHRSWTATDNCGRATTATQIITVEDNTAPVFTGSTSHLQLPANNSCEANVNLNYNGNISDNCAAFNFLLKTFVVRNRANGSVVITGNGLDASGVYSEGDYDFVFIASDPCGNIDSLVRRVTIIDNVAPVVSCDVVITTITIPPTGSAYVPPSFLDNGSYDNCTPSNQLIRSTNPDTLTCADIGSLVPVYLIVEDLSGNKDSCVAMVAPIAGPPAAFCDPITVYLDGVGGYRLTEANLDSIGKQSFDACDADTLEYSISKDTFNCSDIGNNTATLTVTNDAGKSATCQASITVVDTIAPTALCYDTVLVYLDGNGTRTILPGRLDSASMDACGIMSKSLSQSVFDCSDIGDNTVTLSVTDTSMNIGQCNSLVIVQDTLAADFQCRDFTAQLVGSSVTVEPGWLLPNPHSVFLQGRISPTGSGNTDYTVVVKASTTLTFDWDFESDDNNNHERFGFLVNNTFTQLSPTNAKNASGSQSVTVSAGQTFGFRIYSDGDNRKSNVEVTNFNVPFSGDYDPVRWSRNLHGGNGRAFIYGNVSDNCSDIEDLTFEVSRDGISYFSSVSFDCDSIAANPHQVYLKITDQYGNVDSCLSAVTIVDLEPPVAICPPPFSVTLDQNGQFIVSNSFALPFVMALSTDNCAVDSVAINPDTLTCNDIGTNTVTFTVYDLYGNNSNCTTDITVQENTPPTIICPADTVVSCANLPQDTIPSNSGIATATDNCGLASITYTDVTVSGNQPNCFTFERTWKATDLANNMMTCVQTISVIDTVAPVLQNTAAQNSYTFYLNPPNCTPPAAVNLTAVDDCRGSFAVTPSQSSTQSNNTANSSHYNYTLTRTWVASDNCGNFDSHLQVVTVRDTTGPEFLNSNMIMVGNDPGECRAFVTLQITADSIRDCAPYGNLTIANNSIRGNGAEDASGYYTVTGSPHVITFTATDPSGNVSSHTVTIIVKDLETPTAVCANNNSVQVVLNSNGIGNLTIGAIDAGSNDNCGITSLVLSRTQFTCADLGAQNVTLTVSDAAGNSSQCTTTITVVDGSSIAISCPPDITITCQQSINPFVTGTPSTTSACGSGALSYADRDSLGASPSRDCRIIIRTWTLTNGNSTVSCEQLIYVVDNTAPNIAPAPADTLVNCESVPPAVNLTATDNCKGGFSVAPAISSSQDPNPNNSGHYNYTVLRNWTATDSCGNSASTSQLITVQDTTRPVLSFATPDTIPTATNLCDTFVNINLFTKISDNCAANQYLAISVNGTPGNGIISGRLATGTYNYNVTVSDPSGNVSTGVYTLVIEDQQSPDAVCRQGFVIVLDNTGNATITVADVDNGSSDNCTPTPQLSMSINPSSFTTADIGPVQITLTVTDQSGNTNTCIANATVVGGTVVQAANRTAIENTMDTVPVMVSQFDNVTAFEFDVDVHNAAVASAVSLENFNAGLSQGLLVTTSNANGFFVTWIDTTGAGLSLSDGAQLLGLKVNITGSAGDTTTTKISNLEVSQLIGGMSTVVTSYGQSGSITVVGSNSNFTLSGGVFTETNVPVELVDLALTGTSTAASTTGASGTFSFVVQSGANSTITPSKNINWRNGVTTSDALAVLQHIGGTPLGSPYKIIAADANHDEIITSNDASNILLLALNYINSLPNNTSWRFVPQIPPLPADPFSVTFDEFFNYNPVLMDSMNINFTGIKIGDVNNSAKAYLKPDGAALELHLEDAYIADAGLIAVPVKAKDFRNMNAYQFTLAFDESRIIYAGVEPGVLPNFSDFNINDNRAAEGLLATGWLQLESVDIPDGATLFTLYFESRKGDFRLSQVLEANGNYIPMEVVAGTDIGHRTDLVFNTTTSSQPVAKISFDLYQNIPNPFKNESVIGFELPHSSTAVMTVTDVAGRVIYRTEGDFATGYNEIRINRADLPATGVFYYQLKAGEYTAVRKMILLE